jgi:dolichol kinase
MDQTLVDQVPSAIPDTRTATIAAPETDPRLVTARRIFRGALIFNAALTTLWLGSMATGRGTMFFSQYRPSWQSVAGVAGGVLVFYVLWGFIWWGVKAALLRWMVGFTAEERRDAFSSRMDRPYDVAALTAKYSERLIRISDMIGRRGRFITLQAPMFYFLYKGLRETPDMKFATAFLGDSLFDAVAIGWIFLGVFYVNGFIGATFYGPQSRVMDGRLARANCLLITTLWAAFKFVMVPLGGVLATLYPKNEFAVMFVLIWVSYMMTDACAEIFGSLFGRQSIKVWGVGDVNRKSLVGVVAGFLGAFIVGLIVVLSQGLGLQWIGLTLVIALSGTLVELYSPRGTDDFTMTLSNALICLAFGLWLR